MINATTIEHRTTLFELIGKGQFFLFLSNSVIIVLSAIVYSILAQQYQ